MAETVKPSELDVLTGDPADSAILTITTGGKTYQIAITDLLTRALKTSLFDANTILAANADDTPAALTIAEQRLIGRITSGNIAALTAAQIRTLIDVAEGSTKGLSVVEKTITNSQLLRANLAGTPVEIIAAPGANKMIVVTDVFMYYSGSVFIYQEADTTETQPSLVIDNGTSGWRIIPDIRCGNGSSSATLVPYEFSSANNMGDYYQSVAGYGSPFNAAVKFGFFDSLAGSPAFEALSTVEGSDGNGDLKLRVYYRIEDFS